MTDVHDKKTRSYNMSMIRSKDTKPEIIVRKFPLGTVSDINFMIKHYLVSQTLFSQNIKRLYLFMVASGMVMRAVNIS